MSDSTTGKLTHIGDQGNAHMVDVGTKPLTDRRAVAEGWVELSPTAFSAITERRIEKGDVLAIAQLAGIQGAKRTADLVPLCHPLPIDGVAVRLQAIGGRIHVLAEVNAHWRTGVEMEALTAVSAAALTVYDMVKAVDKGVRINGIRLLEKHGGRSGSYTVSD